MTAMKIYADDGRNDLVNPEIHGSLLSFLAALGQRGAPNRGYFAHAPSSKPTN
jgi:hypothetical protein